METHSSFDLIRAGNKHLQISFRKLMVIMSINLCINNTIPCINKLKLFTFVFTLDNLTHWNILRLTKQCFKKIFFFFFFFFFFFSLSFFFFFSRLVSSLAMFCYYKWINLCRNKLLKHRWVNYFVLRSRNWSNVILRGRYSFSLPTKIETNVFFVTLFLFYGRCKMYWF